MLPDGQLEIPVGIWVRRHPKVIAMRQNQRITLALSGISIVAALASLGVIYRYGLPGSSSVVHGENDHLKSKPTESHKMTGFMCKRCGEYHAEIPLNYHSQAPVYYDEIPEKERGDRARLSEEQCVIDGKHFFIAGNVEIPIKGSDKIFSYTVWVSLSEENFHRASELWHSKGREQEPPYFGWLSTALPGFPNTVNIKTMVHTQPIGIRPTIELEPTDHPLAVEQREGISWERIQEIAQFVLHSVP